MNIVDVGSGPPIVVIPGIQGRWEWMRPGIRALAARCRVITFSLADEPTCRGSFDESSGFNCYVAQVREALNQAGLERATICGVSYGGLVAAAFAARYPERTHGLVLVSALPPTWVPDARVRFYLRAPRLLSPLFCLASPIRMYGEIAAANDTTPARARAVARHGWNVATHMFSPTRMARRVRLLDATRLDDIAGNVEAPTLIVHGEPALDCVVPVRATLDYQRLIPHATIVTIERTGHLGFITRPEAFVSAVAPFIEESATKRSRRRVG
jgi:pimeloyl-ACP methyl ester carboxylesterase